MIWILHSAKKSHSLFFTSAASSIAVCARNLAKSLLLSLTECPQHLMRRVVTTSRYESGHLSLVSHLDPFLTTPVVFPLPHLYYISKQVWNEKYEIVVEITDNKKQCTVHKIIRVWLSEIHKTVDFQTLFLCKHIYYGSKEHPRKI